MSKSGNIDEITTILAGALRHKIGALVGVDELYFKKYMLEFNARLEKAKKIIDTCNFNMFDKQIIKEKIKVKLKKELENRNYIDNKKFDLIDGEIDKVLKELNLI